jgi:chromosomal replication initiator protein
MRHRHAIADEPGSSPADPWDGFLVGPENALAYAATRALARGEDGAGSPLVVHGPSGAGKSRVLAGLVGEWLARNSGAAVAHLGAEAFAGLCIDAIEGRADWAELRGRFRGLDLLVVEDLHALGRVPPAYEELAHTLDALGRSGGVVAVSAREGPGHWTAWPRRLVSRLTGGLAVRVDPPGLASRRRYTRDRARARGLRLSAEAVEALAGPADGYRTLDGWLARLALAARDEPGPIDRPWVEPILAEEGATSSPTIDGIARDVATRFGVRTRDLRSDARHGALVGPRHLAMHLARELTGQSFAAIGAYFGRRDAATVRHACRAASRRLEADPALAAAAEALKGRWQRVEPGDDTPSH